MPATCSTHLIIYDLTILTLFGEEYKLWRSSFVIFPASCYVIPLWFKYSPQHPVVKHTQSVFFNLMRQSKSPGWLKGFISDNNVRFFLNSVKDMDKMFSYPTTSLTKINRNHGTLNRAFSLKANRQSVPHPYAVMGLVFNSCYLHGCSLHAFASVDCPPSGTPWKYRLGQL
jgi:hypothetical protein